MTVNMCVVHIFKLLVYGHDMFTCAWNILELWVLHVCGVWRILELLLQWNNTKSVLWILFISDDHQAVLQTLPLFLPTGKVKKSSGKTVLATPVEALQAFIDQKPVSGNGLISYVSFEGPGWIFCNKFCFVSQWYLSSDHNLPQLLHVPIFIIFNYASTSSL